MAQAKVITPPQEYKGKKESKLLNVGQDKTANTVVAEGKQHQNSPVVDDIKQIVKETTPDIPENIYSKEQIDAKFATKVELETLKKNTFLAVDTLQYPTLESFLASEGEEGVIYLYPVDQTDSDKGYYQYIWENDAWLPLGTTKLDLSPYYTGAFSDARYERQISDRTINDAAVTLTLDSLEPVVCTTALTSLAINSLTADATDNVPQWRVKFKVASSFAGVTFPTGTFTWAFGQPTVWDTDITYTLIIEKDIGSNAYLVYRV